MIKEGTLSDAILVSFSPFLSFLNLSLDEFNKTFSRGDTNLGGHRSFLDFPRRKPCVVMPANAPKPPIFEEDTTASLELHGKLFSIPCTSTESFKVDRFS